jgi:hypothetical protein
MEKTLEIELDEQRQGIINLLKDLTCQEENDGPCRKCVQINTAIKAITDKSDLHDTP